MKPGQTDKAADVLRNHAETHLAHQTPTDALNRSAEELLHELQVHQIELEMQNEALREAQLALEKSRDCYVDLYEFAPVGYLTLNGTGLIAEINLTGAELLGIPRNQLVGRRFATLITSADGYRWNQLFIRAMRDDDHQYCDLKLQRGDGSLFNAQLDGQRIGDLSEEYRLRIMLTDITERHNAQARELRLRHILDNTLDMIFIFSPNTLCFEYINTGAAVAIGYNREEILLMTPPDILLLESEPECRAFLAPLISGKKKTLRFETSLRCRNGMALSVEAQLQLVQDQQGGSVLVAIVRDITRRKAAEDELRRQKNLMWQVIDMDRNLIFVRDSDGKFLLANQSVANYYGLPIRSLIGKNNAELGRYSQNIEGFLASDQHVIANLCETSSTESAVMPDGQQRWYLTVKQPLRQADGSVNALCIAADITDLKESKNRLAESYRELQRLSLHLENVRAEEQVQIARNLHDEMGAILVALKMRCAWLGSKLPREIPEIIAEVGHISQLTAEGIQTIRQIVSDLRPNLLDDVGLAAAVKDYAKKFQHDTGIECKLIMAEESHKLTEEQSVTIFRIIQESLTNIAKHAHASRVELRFTLQEKTLRLEISDNGRGFDPTIKTHSFGLLGIRERALMIGGKAAITSCPGQGTCVSLAIPLDML